MKTKYFFCLKMNSFHKSYSFSDKMSPNVFKRTFFAMSVAITYEAIKNGDVKVFEALFQEFYPSMCMVATKFITDQNAAEDIAQEAFIKLWEKRETYDDIPNLKTFLYVSVKNLCFNHIRDKKNTVDYTSPEVENQEAIFKDLVIEEEAYRIIEDAVNALPPQSARIVKMYLDGKQNKEISEILGISVNSVKTLKYNALNSLKTILKEYFYVLLLFLVEK